MSSCHDPLSGDESATADVAAVEQYGRHPRVLDATDGGAT